MPRSPTTSDVFNAIAEVQRRKILDLLTDGERSVNEVAKALDLRQPQTSKHLGVLKQVGLVNVRGEGQQRLYQLNAKRLKPIFEWIRSFERFWDESFDRLEEYLKELQTEEREDSNDAA
jgi:DNA-binding transcriptional ArsR family regulator